QFTGSRPRTGCRSLVAGMAPKRSSRTASGASVTRLLIQTWSTFGPQLVKTLTLYPLALISSKMLEQGLPAQAFEDSRPHLVCRLDVQDKVSDRADGAEPDDQPVEVSVAPRCGDDLARRGDNFQSSDCRGKVPARVPGAVGRGHHGDSNGDV